MAKVKRGQNNSEDIRDSIVEGMVEKKAENIIVIDIRKLFNPLADFLVICSATSERHAEAVSEEIEKMVLKNQNEHPWVSEGKDLNEWIILDYINVVSHVFLEEKREHFALEELWGDGLLTKIEIGNSKLITD